jgi:hypothetical protein
MFENKILEVVLKVKFNGDLYHFKNLARPNNSGPSGAVPVPEYPPARPNKFSTVYLRNSSSF